MKIIKIYNIQCKINQKEDAFLGVVHFKETQKFIKTRNTNYLNPMLVERSPLTLLESAFYRISKLNLGNTNWH